MPIIGSVVEGDTVRQTLTLFENGLAFDGSGFTVQALFITGIDGQAVDTAGKFGWSDATLGKVYFDPTSTDFQVDKSPYRVRARLADGSSKTRSYPNDGTAEIRVLSHRQ